MYTKEIEDILNDKGEIKEIPFPWLPNGRDFVSDPENKDNLEALYRKYELFALDKGEEDTSWCKMLCISEEDYNEALFDDFYKIINTLASFGSDNKTPISVRHCYTPNGYGYFALSKDDMKRFVPSSFAIQRQGGCWSYFVWRRLYFGNAILMSYLEDLKKELSAKYDDFHMDIVPLYMCYIASKFVYIDPDRLKDLKDERRAVDIDITSLNGKEDFLWEKFLHYKELLQAQKNFCILHREYFKKVEENQSNIGTYNGDESNRLFYAVEEILHNAAFELSMKEDELKSVDLWMDAYKQRQLLYRYEYNINKRVQTKGLTKKIRKRGLL